jgi:chromosome partitioning protein
VTRTYTSKEVADLAGVSKETLREWEASGSLSDVVRDSNNHRAFTPEHLHKALSLAGRLRFQRISIVNQKGGVGKTTTSFNLGGALALKGQRVLLVDLDAQANLTISFGINPDEVELTSNNLLVEDKVTAKDVILRTRFENIWLIPADIRLAGADIQLREMMMREKVLETKLRPWFEWFNYILFDCPPNLSTITINALVASTEAIVPIETQCYSMKAIDDLTNTFNLLRDKMGHQIKTWILPTKIDRRLKLSNRMLEMLTTTFGGRLLTPIKTDASVAKAPLVKQPMVFGFPASRSARDYLQVAEEVLGEVRPAGVETLRAAFQEPDGAPAPAAAAPALPEAPP